jgi:hypothetical protein
LQALAVAYALLGGAIASALLFAGLSLGAFAIGLAVTFGLVAATTMGSHVRAARRILAGYSFAFVLPTWPLLLLGASALWGKWQ